MENISIDPYTTQRINLGSGPRERAAGCSCNYRTSQKNATGICYTQLNADPLLIPRESQQRLLMGKRGTAPLVRQLRRESLQKPTTENKKSRPFSATTCSFSATTCSQRDYTLQASHSVINSLAVNGQNINYQPRPLLKRASENFITDHAIRSIQQATFAELSRNSPASSSKICWEAPNPPCPSPEELDEGQESQEDLCKSPTSRCSHEEDELKIKYEFGKMEETNLYDVENVVEDVVEDANCRVDQTKHLQEGENVDKLVLNQTRGKRQDEMFSTIESRRKLEFTVPSGRENVLSDSEEGFLITDEKTAKSLSNTNPDVRLQRCKNEPFNNQLGKRCRSSKTQRPFSAFNNSYRTLKGKKLEFISEKEAFNAKLCVSERTLETLLYMDFLKKKDELQKENSKDTTVSDAHNEIEVLNQKLASASIFEKKKKKHEIPQEMIVIANRKVPRREESRRFSNSCISSIIARKDREEKTKETQPVCETLNYLERKENSARRALLKADTEINQRKKERKDEVSMIWRSITGVDTGLKDKRHEVKIKLSLNDKSVLKNEVDVNVESLVKENEIATLKEEMNEIEHFKKIKADCITGSEVPRTNNFKEDDPNNLDLSGNRIEDEKSVLLEKKRPKIIKKIHFTDEKIEQRIIRPTSAVIMRNIEKKKNKGENDSVVKRKSSMKQRPSSSVNSLHTRKIVERNAARFHSASYEAADGNSKKNKAKVVSSEKHDPKPANKQTVLTEKPERLKSKPKTSCRVRNISVTPRSNVKRPISAPSRQLQLPPSISGQDIARGNQKISDECNKILDTCEKNGIKMSMETLRRALMPPCERAKPYSRENMPHPSRLLSSPSLWSSS